MPNTPNGMPPLIVPGTRTITIDDSEPLIADPDPFWAHIIHAECQLVPLNNEATIHRFTITLSSESSDSIEILPFDDVNNQITVVVNDTPFSNGAPITKTLDSFNRVAGSIDVNVEIQKSGQKVGRAKHKMGYNPAE